MVQNFTDHYLEDTLSQTKSKSAFIIELVQTLIPNKSNDPYRNLKNLGLLMDLIEMVKSGLSLEKENFNIESNRVRVSELSESPTIEKQMKKADELRDEITNKRVGRNFIQSAIP